MIHSEHGDWGRQRLMQLVQERWAGGVETGVNAGRWRHGSLCIRTQHDTNLHIIVNKLHTVAFLYMHPNWTDLNMLQQTDANVSGWLELLEFVLTSLDGGVSGERVELLIFHNSLVRTLGGPTHSHLSHQRAHTPRVSRLCPAPAATEDRHSPGCSLPVGGSSARAGAGFWKRALASHPKGPSSSAPLHLLLCAYLWIHRPHPEAAAAENSWADRPYRRRAPWSPSSPLLSPARSLRPDHPGLWTVMSPGCCVIAADRVLLCGVQLRNIIPRCCCCCCCHTKQEHTMHRGLLGIPMLCVWEGGDR